MKKRKWFANWGLKLASLVFAALLWLIVSNVNDPIVSVRFNNVAVNLVNTDQITSKGQVYSVLDGTDVINSVVIYAKRSVADTFTRDNVIATADVSDMSSLNTVTIKVTTNKYSDQIQRINTSTEAVKLSIENKVNKTLALSATTSGTVQDGYAVGNVTIDQNLIRLSGPESKIDKVASAKVDVDVTGFTSDIGTDADIKLYDSEGNAVTEDGITMNIDSVRVNVTILKVKYVPIVLGTTGVPAEGYQATGVVDIDPDQIKIAGKSGAVDRTESIDIDPEVINIGGATGDVEQSINISDYLPSGITLGDAEFNGMVNVVVHIEPLVDKILDVPSENITISNVPDEYTASLVTENNTVQILVSGLNQTLANVSAEDITGNIDLAELSDNIANGLGVKVGTHKESITWTLPGGVSAKDETQVDIDLEKAE